MTPTPDQLIRRGHFELTSGRHTDVYLQTAGLTADLADLLADLASDLSRLTQAEQLTRLDGVVTPALGGIVLGTLLALYLGVPLLWVERPKSDQPFQFRRGFQPKAHHTYLIADNVLTTGGSLRETGRLIRDAGGIVGACYVWLNRSSPPLNWLQIPPLQEEIPIFARHHQQIQTWPPDQCVLCREHLPLDKPGSRTLQEISHPWIAPT